MLYSPSSRFEIGGERLQVSLDVSVFGHAAALTGSTGSRHEIKSQISGSHSSRRTAPADRRSDVAGVEAADDLEEIAEAAGRREG